MKVQQAEKGIILILVLWMMLLLGLMATSWSYSVRTEARLGAQLIQSAAAEALAAAGVTIGIEQLLRYNIQRVPLVLHGIAEEYQINGQSVYVSIRSERGKIDLNEGNPSVLYTLLLKATEDATKAEALQQEVLKWRNSNQRYERNSADTGYPFSTLHRPRGRYFTVIEELLTVEGMNRQIYNKIKEDITVHSYSNTLNVLSASRNALFAIPDVTARDVEKHLAARDTSPVKNYFTDNRYTSTDIGNIFSISSSVRSNNTSTRLLVVVAILPDMESMDRPYQILSWRTLPYTES